MDVECEFLKRQSVLYKPIISKAATYLYRYMDLLVGREVEEISIGVENLL